MQATPSLSLLQWIQTLNDQFMALNTAVIQYYELKEIYKNRKKDFFHLPLLAAKDKRIPRIATIDLPDIGETHYHTHGTGITLKTNEMEVRGDYFPRVSPVRLPVFGPFSVACFVRSMNPESLWCNEALCTAGIRLLAIHGYLVCPYEGYLSFFLADGSLGKEG